MTTTRRKNERRLAAFISGNLASGSRDKKSGEFDLMCSFR